MSKRFVAVDDVVRMELPSNPVLSPDGTQVVFEKTVGDIKEDGYNTQLYIADSNGVNLRPLTSSGTSNTGAVWSPDGTSVAFVSNRAFGSQVWVLSMFGGEARQLTRFRYGMTALTWSVDGTKLFGLVPVKRDGTVECFAADVTDKEAKEELDKENKEFADHPKRYERLYYKMDGAGLKRHRCSQLVVVNIKTGAYQALTEGPHDVDGFTLSPDGETIALISYRGDTPDQDWMRSDVYSLPSSGGQLQLVTKQLMASQLAFSPDGQSLAVIGHGEEMFEYWSAAHQHLFILKANGDFACVTKGFPDTIGDTCLSDVRGGAKVQPPVWSKDGRHIFVLSSREGKTEIVRFDAMNFGHCVVVGGDRAVYGFDTKDARHLVISYATATEPGVIAAVELTESDFETRTRRDVTEAMRHERAPFFPSAQTRLDDSNVEFFAELTLVEPEPFWYRSQDNWEIQGWVMKPANYTAGQTYPVILEIHGGPQLNYGYTMFHEMQWLAAKGYAVVFTNPRGGMSYGQTFVNAVRHSYGKGDAADVLHGLDAAIAQFDFLDGSRVAVTGGSYGGFMTNWLVGHTDRFFAAVSQRSISNWISFYGVSDCGPLFIETQLGGDIYSNFDNLWDMSPLKYAPSVTTPLLLVHSENDLRCPMEQAEQFYSAIKHRGGEVELFRVPNASHGLSRNGKPKLRIARLNAIFDYIEERLPQA